MSDNRELDRLDNVQLVSGAHRSWEQGACLMEAVAYVAGEAHSDRPVCASPVLGTFGRNLNDVLPDDLRQQLKPLVPLLIGTANDGCDEARSLLALDWLIHIYLPTWLRVGGLAEQANAVAGLAPITDLDTAQAAGAVVRAVRNKARAKARGEARGEARAKAWDGAWGAAWAAAWDEAWGAAWDAAWDTAWDAAWDAASAAAWAAASAAAWAAARDEARDALAPTVHELQTSAIDLFGRMITVGVTNEGTAPTLPSPVHASAG